MKNFFFTFASISVLIIALSVAYYFVYYLPNTQKTEQTSVQGATVETTSIPESTATPTPTNAPTAKPVSQDVIESEPLIYSQPVQPYQPPVVTNDYQAERNAKCIEDTTKYNLCMTEYNVKLSKYNKCLQDASNNPYLYSTACFSPGNYCSKPYCTIR